MKVLTIKQPWAQLILTAGKDIENRDWYSTFTGRFLIHSSAKLDLSELCEAGAVAGEISARIGKPRPIPDIKFGRGRGGCLKLEAPLEGFPLGCILGSVEMVGCVIKSESPWFFGRYGFVLRNPRLLAEPIPVKGALGFWEYPDLDGML